MAANQPTTERAFGVTNIKSHIPLILDLNDHNYDAWRELFLTHCLTFDVLGHVDGSLLPTDDNDEAWKKRDGLVKLWIYGTLAPPLFRSSFKTGGTARDIWLRIENQFRNNKEARAIQLDSKLRTTEIGDLSIQEYCQKLKSLADLLENVDAPVSECTLVMYLLNGLNERYDNIINVIKHKEPFPTFAIAKSMLKMEETRLKKFLKPAQPSTIILHHQQLSRFLIKLHKFRLTTRQSRSISSVEIAETIEDVEALQIVAVATTTKDTETGVHNLSGMGQFHIGPINHISPFRIFSKAMY